MEEYREGSQVETTTNMVRALAQFAGLLLLVFGVAVSLHVLFKVMRIWEEPTRLNETMAQWEEVLETRLVVDAEEKEWDVGEWSVQTEEGQINMGRLLSLGACILWTALSVWIPLALCQVGGKLLTWNLDERQIRKLLKELLPAQKQRA